MQRQAVEAVSSVPPRATPSVADEGGGRSPVVRRRLLIALAASVLLHAITSLWRGPDLEEPAPPPLQVELREIPPPPRVSAATPPPRTRSPAEPRPVPIARPGRRTEPTAAEPPPAVVARATDAPVDVEAPASPGAGEAAAAASPGDASAPGAGSASPAPPVDVVGEPAATTPLAADAASAPAGDPAPTLPPVVDLMYSAFYGPGLLVGTVGYRFERDGKDYRIETLGRGAGLVALLYPGVLKVTSRGEITTSGLLPDELVIERSGSGRRESTRFDRPGGLLVLHQKAPQPLDSPTYDLLTFWLRFYFAPPAGDEVEFRVATTRSLREFKLRRSGEEVVVTALGEVPTNVWRRVRRDDGEDRLDVTLWLAPQWHQLPVKVRLAGARGSVEQVLLGVRAGLDVPEAMRETRRLELPLDQNGEFVQEDRFTERAHTP